MKFHTTILSFVSRQVGKLRVDITSLQLIRKNDRVIWNSHAWNYYPESFAPTTYLGVGENYVINFRDSLETLGKDLVRTFILLRKFNT